MAADEQITVTVSDDVLSVQYADDPINVSVTEQTLAVQVISEDLNFTQGDEVIQVVFQELVTGMIAEEEVAYAKRTDFVGDTIIYRGEAVPGTANSTAAWRIRRLTLNSETDVDEEWADGNANFDNVWDNRASLTYS